jgi:hypothetical protein
MNEKRKPENCFNCKHIESSYGRKIILYCSQFDEEHVIEDKFSIPPWCSLEDYKTDKEGSDE